LKAEFGYSVFDQTSKSFLGGIELAFYFFEINRFFERNLL